MINYMMSLRRCSKSRRLHSRINWEVVFTDDEGDMMLVGDDPWPIIILGLNMEEVADADRCVVKSNYSQLAAKCLDIAIPKS
ncbi:AUX/IAA domain [Dillenia turbinata]|uniref:Auxin-responsive protein n=1 Tax=Dillenia turbinata TaxID=194707 RepID=A0AAN8ZIK4_9MAGN